MPKLVFKYDQAGNVDIDGQGFVGKSCETATAPFLAGRKVTKNDKKKEFYQTVAGSGGITQGR
jgi:hypothetical protein